jgi:hypothetical protein
MKQNLILVLALLLVLGGVYGCCSNPGVFAQIDASMQTIQQAYYDFSGKSKLDTSNVDAFVALGGTAADTALALAGDLQSQWCPSQGAADQLATQVKVLPLVANPVN